MDSKEILYLVVIGAVLLGAIFWLSQSRPALPDPVEPVDTNVQVDLFLRALRLGESADNYRYAYRENINGFSFAIELIRTAEGRAVYIDSPLAREEIFFSDNATTYCIETKNINGSRLCAPADNATALQPFVSAARSLFFDAAAINSTVAYHRRLISEGAIVFQGLPVEKTVNGNACTQINYQFDLRDLSLSELASLNLSPGTLPTYNAQWCVGAGGEIYEKVFSYTVNGVAYRTLFEWESAEWDYADALIVPETDANTSQLTSRFTILRDHQTALQSCFSRPSDARDQCVATFAIQNRFPLVCEWAGARRDSCYLLMVTRAQDTTFCEAIQNTSKQDSCYIEIAGRTQNASACENIRDPQNVDVCMNASQTPLSEPPPQIVNESETPANESNATARDPFIDELLRRAEES